MNRRSILSLVMGVPTLASAGVTPKQVIAAAAVSPSPSSSTPVSSSDYRLPYRSPKVYEIQEALRRRMETLQWRTESLPTHIESKRSWSPVFKQSEARKEFNQLQAALRRLEEDEDFAERIINALL